MRQRLVLNLMMRRTDLMMNDEHTILLRHGDQATYTKIKVEGLPMARLISMLLCHRPRNKGRQYHSITIYNKDGEPVCYAYQNGGINIRV